MSMQLRRSWNGLWLVVFFFFIATLLRAQLEHSVIPKEGFVPDRETAIKIAEAVWTPIYGAEKISQEKPFVAELRNGVWIVSGTLPSAPPALTRKGGVATIEIAKRDGRILAVSHGK